MHSSIGQNIKSHAVSGIRYPVSVLRSECEQLQMAITQQRVIRSTSCLVLGWVFLARVALFNLSAHELHELYYDRPTS